MAPKVCSIPECERPRSKRGWCNAHYLRWYRHGSIDGGKYAIYATPEEAFSARTTQSGDCLVWTGALLRTGYGHLNVDGKMIRAHRFAWERANGPIPEGMLIDHRCWNKACVNVEHLRLATREQNQSNREGRRAGRKLDLPRNVIQQRNGRYNVRVRKDGVTHYCGAYGTIEEATEVAAQKRASLFGAYAGRG